MTFELNQQEKETLLSVARGAIAERLGVPLDNATVKPPQQGRLIDKSGAFVTLTMDGELRGCVGHIIADKSLFETVKASARMAAFEDSRFPPLSKSDFTTVSIEISVMSEPRPVASYRDIEIGKHGVILKKNGHSALFLPKVATEQRWDIVTTLTHLAIKAGLASDGWREGANFAVFEAEVFAEDE